MRLSPIALILPLVLLGCTSTPTGPASSASSSSVAVSSAASSSAVGHYENPGIGYSIEVAAGWTVQEDKQVVTEDYQATGTAFVATAETRTTLSEAYFHVSQVATCPSLTKTTPVTIAGKTFQRATWSGVGAGNLYEGVSYFGAKDAGCLLMTGYLHSCNLGADCGENHSAPFDKAAYISKFDAMAKSVQFLEHPGE